MNLTPTELDRLTIFTAAEFARRNLRLGIRLSHPEAVAYLTDEAMTMARQDVPYDEIRSRCCALLTEAQVLSGVAAMIPSVVIELPMLEGTKLLALFDPILPVDGLDGDLDDVTPGEVIPAHQYVDVAGPEPTVEIEVVNTGDRDVQVRSHTHFFEVNRALAFDRQEAYGRRLAVPAGSGVRFEPGIPRRVALTPLSGTRDVHGFAGLTDGPLDATETRVRAMANAADRGYLKMERMNDFD